MKKTESRKLSLNRETLVPLQSADLDNVNGGTGWICASVKASVRYCTIVTTVLGANGGQQGGQGGGAAGGGQAA